jgi:hypothetical protein
VSLKLPQSAVRHSSDNRLDNVDYNALKHLLKVNTTRDQGQAVAIPGHVDAALHKFEEKFFNELYNQHDRVELFVPSKADEISRRLRKSSQLSKFIVAMANLDTRIPGEGYYSTTTAMCEQHRQAGFAEKAREVREIRQANHNVGGLLCNLVERC